jgi:hypothetical protein
MDSNQTPGLGLQTPAPNNGSPGVPTLPIPDPIPQMPPVTPSGDAAEALDQEWVNKAKDIVEQTKGDPFAQSKELNKVRAGYLKARYNKELEIGEDGA